MNAYIAAVLRARVVRFVAVGGFGFCIDGGLLTLLSQLFQIDVHLARLMSFSVATLATWRLNRVYVFAAQADAQARKSAEYGRYFSVQICGAFANLIVFSTLVAAYPEMHSTPVIPLFFGALLGLLVNFTGARYWVFVKRHREEINV